MSRKFHTPRARRHGRSKNDRPVARIFTVLLAVREGGEPVTLAGLVQRTGLPKSTVHRLLVELHAHGVLCKDGDRYRLGPMALRLITPAEAGRDQYLRRAFTPLLTALHSKTRYLVGLGVPGGMAVNFVGTVYDEDYSWLIRDVEETSPLDVSAAGKVLLAYDPGLMANFAARSGERSAASGSMGLPPGLHAELSQVRRRGMAVSEGGPHPGITAAAVPVFSSATRPVAALSMGAYDRRFDTATAYGLLRRAGAHAHEVLRRYSFEDRT